MQVSSRACYTPHPPPSSNLHHVQYTVRVKTLHIMLLLSFLLVKVKVFFVVRSDMALPSTFVSSSCVLVSLLLLGRSVVVLLVRMYLYPNMGMRVLFILNNIVSTCVYKYNVQYLYSNFMLIILSPLMLFLSSSFNVHPATEL